MKIKFPQFEGSDRVAIMRAGKLRHTVLTETSIGVIESGARVFSAIPGDPNFSVISTRSRAAIKTASEVACAGEGADCKCSRIQQVRTDALLDMSADANVLVVIQKLLKEVGQFMIVVLDKPQLESLFGVAELSDTDFPPGAMIWQGGSAGING